MGTGSALTERDAFWLEHLRACGGGSLKAYAQANNVDVKGLYAAKARLRRKGVLGAPPPRLVRVERARGAPGGPAYCRVLLPNGAAVELACESAQWRELLASVAALP